MKSREFRCVLCASDHAPKPLQKNVKGDIHNSVEVVRCRSCGHIQLDPPTYSLEFYKEDGQVNFVVHDYGTPIEKIVEHSWIDASRRVKRFGERGVPLDRDVDQRPLRVLDIGGGMASLPPN